MSASSDRGKKPTRRPLVKSEQRKTTKGASSRAKGSYASDDARAAAEQRRAQRKTAQTKPSAKKTKTVHVTPKATPLEMVDSLMRTNIAARIVIGLIAVLIVVGIGDALANMGKAYAGITIEGVDVAGMNEQQIRETIESSLKPHVEQGMVKIYSSEEARSLVNNELAQMENEAQAEQISLEEARAMHQLWTPTAASLGASVDVEKTIQDALSYARGLGSIPDRFSAAFGGHDIALEIKYDEFAINNLVDEIDSVIGDQRIDTTVAVQDGVANVVDGHDGMLVNRDEIKQHISEALKKTDESGFVAQASFAPSRISHEQALDVANSINSQLERPKSLVYNGHAWSPDRATLGRWIRVSVVDEGPSCLLDVSLDEEDATPGILKGIFAAIDTETWKVTYSKDEQGNITVMTDGNGSLPDLRNAGESLEAAMFGESASVGPLEIEIESTDTPESIPFEQARSLGLVSIIGTYTTEFSDYAGTENRNHNIKRAAELLDNSIIKANGGSWSFNDTTGDTNDSTGFVAAGSIVNGEYVDSIGGGICQVATTVFNAVYEAGLDVIDRSNHTLYIASYPNGRDAAVSYPDLDLVWENNLPSDVLLKTSYTDTTITVTLFSTATGYSVSSEEGQWNEGARYDTKFETDEALAEGMSYTKTIGTDGSSITIYRTVRNNAGEVILQDSFLSVYMPKDEVIVIGPGTDKKGLSRKEREAGN